MSPATPLSLSSQALAVFSLAVPALAVLSQLVAFPIPESRCLLTTTHDVFSRQRSPTAEASSCAELQRCHKQWVMMAVNKRQKTLAGFYHRALEPILELVYVVNVSNSSNSNSSSASNKVATARLLWKEKWLHDYDWLQFSTELGVMYCIICKESRGKGAFATSGSTNFKASTLQDHANTGEHKKLSWATQSGSKRMEKILLLASRTYNKALMTLFKTAYYVG